MRRSLIQFPALSRRPRPLPATPGPLARRSARRSVRRLHGPARPTALLATALLGPLLSACAVGGAPTPPVAPFEPTLGPAETREGREGAGRRTRAGGPDGAGRADGRGAGRRDGRRDGRGARGGPTSGSDSGASGPDGQVPGGTGGSGGPGGSGAPGTTAPGTTGPSGTTSATVGDVSGDATGLGTPAWADLVGGTLVRGATGWSLEIELAGAVPATTSGDRVLDLTLWVDRDGDGAIDDEVLAQLGGDGWTTAYRDPGGARYGADSGVSVSARGATVTLRMPATHLGGSRSLRWVLGAEHGSLAAMTAGTASRDTAPDRGAAPFPG